MNDFLIALWFAGFGSLTLFMAVLTVLLVLVGCGGELGSLLLSFVTAPITVALGYMIWRAL